jgi:hypothetical protein
LLDSLEEQNDYIFITTQIVDEVFSNKLVYAHRFFSESFKEMGAIQTPVPDHLLGINDEKVKELELTDLAAEALGRISRSDDDVSTRFKAVFEKAIEPAAEQMQCARKRREFGNPPGKPLQPLRDQITWEQLLNHCKVNIITNVWMITSDQDYCVKYGKRVLLNAALMRDLIRVCGSALELHCFDELLDGIQHFGKNAGGG